MSDWKDFLVIGFILSMVVTAIIAIVVNADKRVNAPCSYFNNTPAQDVPLRCLGDSNVE